MISNNRPIEIIYAYCDAVLAGEIIACKALIQAIERFYRDLADNQSPYIFEEHVANVYCEFIPKMFIHVEGQFATQPIQLEPWQMFLVASIFAWKRKSDGKRRFRRAFCCMGRKGGKSTIAAVIEILLGKLDQEHAAQVYSTATKRDQALIVHRIAEMMVKASPALCKDSIIHKNNIMFPKDSYCRPLGSDRPFDGTNTHAVVIDELHAWRESHRPFFDTMVSASGTRSQPLEFVITTAGNDKSYIFHEELSYARGVLDQSIDDDRLFVLIFELDDEHDFMDDEFDVDLMLQANPNMGVSVPREFYEDELRKARQKPSAERVFKLKFANQCASSVQQSTKAEDWDRAAGELSNWHDSDGVGAAIDLGGQDDLSSYALEAKFKMDGVPVELINGTCPKCRIEQDGDHCGTCEAEIYRKECFSRSFISEDCTLDLEHEPFRSWIDQGKLVVCKYVDNVLFQHLIEDCRIWGAKWIAYDPMGAGTIAEMLEMEGFTPVKFPQSHGQYHEPIKQYESELIEGRFKPDINDPILRWAFLNMAWDVNAAERKMPSKQKSIDKIDPAVAALMSKKACNQAVPPCTGSLVL